MWADSKFLALSPLPPSGQSLWIYLLTGPHTGPIPGLFRLGPMALAEELGWEQEDFAKAFREVFGEGFGGAFREGMAKADTKARVMALPKAIFHNLPQSPNVVLSWAEEWKSIPESWLKDEAKQQIREALSTVGESYVSVFDKITGESQRLKPSRKPSAKPSRKTMANQEQEQEQEQEVNKETPVSPFRSPKLPPLVGVIERPPEGFNDAKLVYPKRDGGQNWRQAQKAWHARIGEGHTVAELMAGTLAYAGYIRRTGKEGTVYVKQAATFYGPDKHFLADWGPPVEVEFGSLTGRTVV